ncbi:MAG: hypothetical protein B6U95_06245 [Thermofilum sp. ex4484_82]|nr:MAG: hypothetical protein B6U95_06245 [Thermofilum sp. ex4484_82]OYT37618.1 MAG: hypothetical protein B6U96_06235 [Archaeoglobales archaeon ex4484_92]
MSLKKNTIDEIVKRINALEEYVRKEINAIREMLLQVGNLVVLGEEKKLNELIIEHLRKFGHVSVKDLAKALRLKIRDIKPVITTLYNSGRIGIELPPSKRRSKKISVTGNCIVFLRDKKSKSLYDLFFECYQALMEGKFHPGEGVELPKLWLCVKNKMPSLSREEFKEFILGLEKDRVIELGSIVGKKISENELVIQRGGRTFYYVIKR